MKTLFLIDGAAGDVKDGICKMLSASAYSRYFTRIKLIKKYSTRGSRSKNDDIFSDDEREKSKWFKDIIQNGVEAAFKKLLEGTSVNIDYFCYSYPEIDGCKDEYYLIDKEIIDNTLQRDDCDMAILIIRHNATMARLIKVYEEELGYNVVPICIYLDKEYSTKHELDSQKYDELILETKKKKLDKMTSFFFKQRGNYEETLVFSGKDSEEAMDLLALQFKEMIDAIQKRDSEKVVVDKNHKYWLPKRIRHHKDAIQENLKNYSKNIFVMMPFTGHDNLYKVIKEAIEKDLNGKDTEFRAIRADKKRVCADNDAENYWCCSYICKYGFAFFLKNSKDENGKLDLNPNVAYEIALMHQLGKNVYVFPENENGVKIDLFFDIKDKIYDEWSSSNNYETLTTNIRNIINELKQAKK